MQNVTHAVEATQMLQVLQMLPQATSIGGSHVLTQTPAELTVGHRYVPRRVQGR